MKNCWRTHEARSRLPWLSLTRIKDGRPSIQGIPRLRSVLRHTHLLIESTHRKRVHCVSSDSHTPIHISRWHSQREGSNKKQTRERSKGSSFSRPLCSKRKPCSAGHCYPTENARTTQDASLTENNSLWNSSGSCECAARVRASSMLQVPRRFIFNLLTRGRMAIFSLPTR